jgi:hypothetical protein
MDAIDLGATAIQLVKILSGTFLMGSPNVLFSEAPVHEVTIGYEFYLGEIFSDSASMGNRDGEEQSLTVSKISRASR